MTTHRPAAGAGPFPAGVVILVRHGRTALNAAGRLRGHLDPPLDEVGVDQVARLADQLAPLLAQGGPHRILSSPLRRTMQSARAIADRTGSTVTVEDRLVDRDYGVWAGQPTKEVVARWGSLDAAPGVEASARVTARARSVLLEGVTEATRLLVSHDAVLHAILADLDPDLAGIPLEPASWCVIAHTADSTWRVVSTNNHPPQ